MLVRPIEVNEIPAYGALLGRCFAEEGWNAALVEVLADPDSQKRVLRDDSTVWVEAYARLGHAYVVEDLKGLILYCLDSEMGKEQFELIGEQGFSAGIATLTDAEKATVTARKDAMEAVTNGNWMRKMFPGGYGHIGGICVNPDYRGRGIFGALMQTAIDYCNARQIPLCLECYAKPLQAIYGSRGFKLVRTFASADPPVSQFCMVKMPD